MRYLHVHQSQRVHRTHSHEKWYKQSLKNVLEGEDVDRSYTKSCCEMECVSASQVSKGHLRGCHLLKKRSPWKRPHDATIRPEVTHTGALLQADTIHFLLPDGSRLYVYTLIDLFSRWAYAEAVERITAQMSVRFLSRAHKRSSFHFDMIQTDHGSEFSTWFTHALWRMGMKYRHSRVRQSNDNAHVERFNRTIQEECLDGVPKKLKTMRIALKTYLSYYNTERLHMGIHYQTPLEVMQSS